MKLEERIARMLPGRRFWTPPKLRLEADDSKILSPRRRVDCARLGRCEDDWIAAYGGAQARCPDTCRAFRALGGAV